MQPLKVNNILVVFGTRPEAIKMAPLILSLKKKFTVNVCVTAQHRSMLDQVLKIFNIDPDYDLDLMTPNQALDTITSKIIESMSPIIRKSRPDLILVHGDTTTAMATSISAFYQNIPVAHVEAGLRTHNINSPFPEEMNRQVIGRLASYHFTPTETSRNNLLKENIRDESIFVTGNTVIDAVMMMANLSDKIKFSDDLLDTIPSISNLEEKKIILVTGHRRENFGKKFKQICSALSIIANNNPDYELIYPVHLNPNILKPASKILSGIKNIRLVKPIDYLQFIKLMKISTLILTDSGGIQEEAPALNKPVLVMRDSSERPEAIVAGTAILVGTNTDQIVTKTQEVINSKEIYEQMCNAKNPFGDGTASKKITSIIGKISL